MVVAIDGKVTFNGKFYATGPGMTRLLIIPVGIKVSKNKQFPCEQGIPIQLSRNFLDELGEHRTVLT